jgi:Arc/MetJ-type ribon-helix-helix transcriptional regulator
MAAASQGELTGFVILILIFSAATLRYIIKDKVEAAKDKFENNKAVHLWWVVDDLEGNARQWLDWGSRLQKRTRSPFLNIHLRRCKEFHDKDFVVNVMLGRDDVHRVLREHGVDVPAEASIAPSWLWKAWASAQMVCYVGGLWVDSRILFIKSIVPVLGTAKAMRFGTDPEEERGNRASDENLCWAIEEGCGLWQSYARDMDKLVRGGPLSWNSAKIRRAIRYLQDKHLSGQVPINTVAEWTRFKSGKAIQLEDLVTRVVPSDDSGIELPGPNVVAVPLPDTLERSIPNAWFLRLSEDQLLEAKFLWAHLAIPVSLT